MPNGRRRASDGKGFLRDAVPDGDHYADDILTTLPEEDSRSLRDT